MKNKNNIALGLATTVLVGAGVLISPHALAGSKTQHHAEISAMSSKVEALEAQLQALQYELQSLRSESSRSSASSADSAKVQELEQWMSSVKSGKSSVSSDKNDSMVFFRGGFAHNDQVRDDLLTGNQFGGNVVPGVLGGGVTDQQGWYTGAGFDFSLTDDVWGMADGTEIMAELMFEYRNFGKKKFNNNPAIVGNAGPAVNPNPQNGPLCTLIQYASIDELGGIANNPAGSNSCNGVTVTQFTLTAAPKIKFMKGNDFRPWIIPVGLGIHVISPPSNGVTVLNPGAMFAAGAEYRIWKEIKVGMDARYHWTGYDSDGVNTNGLTAGGYLGIGF
jgi:outer membrane murein-binding lipoprotein Lpp